MVQKMAIKKKEESVRLAASAPLLPFKIRRSGDGSVTVSFGTTVDLDSSAQNPEDC
jgi:hypothetical protein